MVAFLLVCASLSTFGQKTDNEVYNTINRSREYNAQKNGVYDPNKIWPGQILDFFENDTQYQVTVNPGDTQDDIVRKLETVKNEGSEVRISNDSLVPPLPQAPEISSSVQKSDPLGILDFLLRIPDWILVIMIVLIVSAILYFFFERGRKIRTARNVDPITAGPPQVPGGVNDAGAHNRIAQLAEARYPSAHLQINNIRRGTLSGPGEVFYSGTEEPKEINLKDVPAYAGEILINGKDETIYFLQGCGNDARMGNYMSGDEFIFTPDVIINEDGSASPLPVEIQAVGEEPKPVVNTGSETHQRKMKILEIVSGEAGSSELHRIIIEEAADGSFKAQIEYKYEPKKATEKKEGQK